MAPKVNYFSAWEWENRFQFRVSVLYLKFLILKTDTIFLVGKRNQVLIFFCFSPTSKSDWKHLLQFFWICWWLLELCLEKTKQFWHHQNTDIFCFKENEFYHKEWIICLTIVRREKKLNVCESKKKQCL